MGSVYTVSQVTSYIKNMFTQDFALNRVSIKGEVSNCKYHTSGHIYFTLKDGGAQIAVGTFWPTVKLHDLRLAARIAGDITTSRLMHMATEAALHVADQLKDWRKQREAEGAESLASVLLTSAGEPVELINGESAKVYRFRRAVYSFTRASVLEGYRDVGTTPKGDKDAEALDRQIDDLWRDGRWTIQPGASSWG